MALTGMAFCIFYFNKPVHDFGNYYFGSRFALQGVSIRDIYEPCKFNLLIRDQRGFEQQLFLENYAVVPPFTLLFYIPFTFLNVYAAKFLFNLISVFVFCFFLFRLIRHFHLETKWIWMLPLALLVPFRNNILFGQTYLLITGFLIGGFLSEQQRKNIPAAIYYALSIALKISPAILLIYLVARKNFRLALTTIAITTLFFFTAVYFTGWKFMQTYLFDFLPRMSANEINNPYATTYQSITILLRNLFIPDQLLNPSAMFNSVTAFILLSGLFTGLLFFFFLKRIRSTEDNFFAFAFTLVSGFLFTAYTSGYSMVLLAPLFLASIRGKPNVLILALTFLICAIPVNAFQSLPLLLRFPRLYLLLILFFVSLSAVKLERKDAAWLSGFIAAFIFFFFIISKRPADTSTYYFDKELSLLSYDYEFNRNNMVFQTMENTGREEKIITLRDTVTTLTYPILKDNQIYFPQQLTFGSDHKLKPVIINNKTLIYLSDKNRGIGFYTLRKMDLPAPVK
jgi:hypothetical protein